MNNQRGATFRSLTVRTIRRIRLNRRGCRGGAVRIQHRGPTKSVYASGTRLYYGPNELRAINDSNNYDKRFKILPYGTIRKIRELQINRRRQKTSIKNEPRQPGVNRNNLIHIRPTNTEGQFYTSNLNIATVNVRSLKNCEQQVLNEIIKGSIDVLVITETWLSNTQDDTHWIQASDLNREPLTCQTYSRMGRRGGGLALVCKSCLKPSLKHSFQSQALEAATWTVTNKNIPICITGVYHPPPREGIINSMFIDTITEYLTNVLSKHKNNIILGDFNIHIEDLSSSDTVIFNNTMEAMGLEQHVRFPTHRCGNTLDLIFTEVGFGPTPAAPHRGPLLSDHHLVSLQLHHKKEIPSRKQVLVRKISKLTTESLAMEFKPSLMGETNHLPTLISELDGELKRTLDTLAPEKMCSITTHVKQPWFDHFVRERHTVVRNRERVWLTYKTQEAWTAYKKEHNIYNRLLKFRKKQVISGMVIDAGRDTKKLYKIINNITGTKEDNPMPPGDSDMEIAQSFAEYFVEKIDKIRDKFEYVPPYSPPVEDIPKFSKFYTFDRRRNKETGVLITE